MADLADLSQDQEFMEVQTALRNALMPPAGCEYSPIWKDGVPHCSICDDVIPQRRLEAMPNTGLCVNCAAMVQGVGSPFGVN